MRGRLWNPNSLKEPLAEGEVEITTWVHTPDKKPRDKATLTLSYVPKKNLALYKGEELYLTLEDGRQAKVLLQNFATFPEGIISVFHVISGWDQKLV